ncbi:hypothetical protein PO124_02400 [Bacillus licheniformis]|nr:hypothetical protein [Bacillus licheniformis]
MLIAVQALQFITMLSVYWLDGYQHIRPAFMPFSRLFFLGFYLSTITIRAGSSTNG